MARDIYNTNPPPGPRRPPEQLGLVPEPFVDRGPVLDMCEAVLTEDRPEGRCGIIAISGPGGMGKTAVATYWAHSVRKRFPDGQLYADLGGLARREIEGIGDLLGDFLLELDEPPEAIPRAVDARAARYKTLTSTRRMLIFLDNAESAAQVERLLPASAGSVVIITSGRALGAMRVAFGVQPLPLDELSTPDGVRLLAEMIGEERIAAEPEAATTVVDLCGGLPLAIRIVAGHLAQRPDRPIARVVDRLTRDRLKVLRSAEGEISVRAVCDEAYEGLPDAAARMYRMLGAHPAFGGRAGRPRRAADFGLAAAAALADVDDDEAEDLLDLLADRNLVDRVADGRYQMRGLLAEHSRGKAEAHESAPARNSAARRAVEWYLDYAVANDRAVNRDRPVFGPRYRHVRADVSQREALDRLDRERRNIRSAVHVAADRGWNDLAWQLCEALWGLYLSRKHYDDWIATHSDGFSAARMTRDPAAVFRVGIQFGRGLFETGEFDRARRVLDEALAAAEETGERLNVATAQEFIGRSYMDEERHGEAIPFIELALELERAGGRTRGVAIDSHHLARIHLALGDRQAALEYADEAIRLFAGIPDRYNQARVLSTLGRIRLAEGDPAAARGPLAEALAIMEKQGQSFHAAELRKLMGVPEPRPGI